MRRLVEHRWEGNVRELANLIQRAVVLSSGETIQPEDAGWNHSDPPPCFHENQLFSLPYHQAKHQVLEQFTVTYLHHVLEQADGNVTRAALKCGLERQSFQQIMRENMAFEPTAINYHDPFYRCRINTIRIGALELLARE